MDLWPRLVMEEVLKLNLYIDKSSNEGLYYYKGIGFRGHNVPEFLKWLHNEAPNCERGNVKFVLMENGFAMKHWNVKYNEHELESIPEEVTHLRVGSVSGYGGYGLMDLRVDVVTPTQYHLHYERLQEPLEPYAWR